ncbi:MAG: hypothetical protein GY830_00845 [Bacteroidetes bacterium]|nr:hypothetical protein [Bacteroidota bacterium]
MEKDFEILKKQFEELLIYAYYKEINNKDSEYEIGIPPHKDFDFLTILNINKSGLEYKINQKWVPLNFKKDYIILNLSKALSLSLGNTVHSGLHKVEINNDFKERLSFGIFMSLPKNYPLIDYKNGKVLYDKYSDYIKMQINKVR